MKKIILTEKQYKALEQYIEEARQEKAPISLKPLFDKNPTAKFFSVVQRLKTGGDADYYFELVEQNGFKMVKDINKMGKTKNCLGDLHLDTMLYGNQVKIVFNQCGDRTINNVIAVNLYATIEDLKSYKILDKKELEHEFDTTVGGLANIYYDRLKTTPVDKHIYIDSKNKWDGIVTRKTANEIEIELFKHGIPINEADDSEMSWNVKPAQDKEVKDKPKPKQKSIILTIDISTNPFYEEDGQLMFKGVSYDRDTDKKTDFVIPVKKFDTNVEPPKEKVEPKVDKEELPAGEEPEELVKKSEEEIANDLKRTYKLILKDPLLQKAFYDKKSQGVWNYFVAALQGKKAYGKGIANTLDLINSYSINKTQKDLNAEFVIGKKVYFEPYQRPVDITYDSKSFQLDTGKKYYGVVRKFNIGDEHYYLDNKNEKFEVLVKSKTNIQDVYKCDVIKYKITSDNKKQRYPKEDVYLKFYKGNESDGYKPFENKIKK